MDAEGILEERVVDAAQPGFGGPAYGLSATEPLSGRSSDRPACFHCGEPCPDRNFTKQEKLFCCQGCLFVHELLAENGLEQFYDLNTHPGVRVRRAPSRDHWDYLDEPELQSRLLDFTDGRTSRVTFHIPAIHCVACVWLLENLFRLLPGLGASEVNFPRREVSISFAPDRTRLSQIVALLVSIGYEPELNFGQLDKPKPSAHRKRLWLQIGLAGFAFGNIMLFSFPGYLGLDSFSGPFFKKLFGYLGLVLALPVLLYSASDYWRSAVLAVRQRMLTLDVPIALGLAALYAQSTFEIVSGRGEGYADSLAGLVFFLLCGRAFQQRTHERIAFDRDYKSFFPLSVSRKTAAGEARISLANLQVGDRLLVRNGELIPADATLLSSDACVDYSFVTGESEPVAKRAGDRLYAGGQQVGSCIEIQTVKPVSQSYLTALWNHEAFQKTQRNDLNTLTNRYSRRFTRTVIAVAAAAAVFWSSSGQPARGLKAFTSVLIVACPCALALAAPFALGTAQRALARRQVFLKNTLVLERLAEVDTIVFDKTGTLTAPQGNAVRFRPGATSSPRQFSRQDGNLHKAPDEDGVPEDLSAAEQLWVRSAVVHSTHPHARQIAEALTPATETGRAATAPVSSFNETAGCGIAACVQGHELRLGSRAWLGPASGPWLSLDLPSGSASYLSIDGQFRGVFIVANAVRPQADHLLNHLGTTYDLALLSGDNEKQRAEFEPLLGPGARLHFNQGPLDKLGFIRNLQACGKRVMMVGDGLNDAGALKQSDVGIAVVEKVGVFSPASDIILEASQVAQLGRILEFAHTSTRVVRYSFAVSGLYNLVGISIAASGILSPLICAILMPLSSVSVVLFACSLTSWAAKRAGFTCT